MEAGSRTLKEGMPGGPGGPIQEQGGGERYEVGRGVVNQYAQQKTPLISMHQHYVRGIYYQGVKTCAL